jgi:hypothetical protein
MEVRKTMTSTKATFTEAEFVQAVRDAVAERGKDYVYSSPDDYGNCKYWHEKNEQPGCLFGLALHKLGVSGEDLYGFDNGMGGGIQDILETSYGLGYEVARAAENAQGAQDNSLAWGDAASWFLSPDRDQAA